MARNRIIPLFIPHAGCPCACVFCDQKKITGMDTPVTPEQVQREIEAALPWAGRGCQLAFYGGSFTAMRWETQEKLLRAAAPAIFGTAALRASACPPVPMRWTKRRRRD